MASEQRIERDKRKKIQEELHLLYGKYYMTNIDSLSDIFIELSDDGEHTLAYAEFKNEGEVIKPFLLRALKRDCDELCKPLYISVLHIKFDEEDVKYTFYWIIPLNDAAKSIYNMDRPKWWTEQQYIWLLSHLRGKKVSKKAVSTFCSTFPKHIPHPPEFSLY